MSRIGLLRASESWGELEARILGEVLPEHDVIESIVARDDAAAILSAADPSYLGFVVDPSLSAIVLSACDLSDGLAKESGSCSLVAVQPTGGASRMMVGFNTEVSGIVRGAQPLLSGAPARALILGGRQSAASALAALVQLKANSIAAAPQETAGRGSALAASHKLGIDVVPYRYSDVSGHVADFDVVVLAGTDIPAELRREAYRNPGGVVIEAVRNRGAEDIAQSGMVVPWREVLIGQIEDQVRVLTGVNPQREVVARAVENAMGGR